MWLEAHFPGGASAANGGTNTLPLRFPNRLTVQRCDHRAVGGVGTMIKDAQQVNDVSAGRPAHGRCQAHRLPLPQSFGPTRATEPAEKTKYLAGRDFFEESGNSYTASNGLAVGGSDQFSLRGRLGFESWSLYTSRLERTAKRFNRTARAFRPDQYTQVAFWRVS